MNAYSIRTSGPGGGIPTAAPKVLLLEPNRTNRSRLASLLQSQGMIGVPCDDATRALFLLRETQFDALVLETGLPGMDGVSFFSQLSKDPFTPAVVFWSASGTVSEAVHCLRLGASDFVSKTEDSSRLLQAIQSAVLQSSRVRYTRDLMIDAERVLSVLSPRERETFDRLVLGDSTAEIADALGVALQTAKVHRSRVMQKLGVSSVTDLVRLDAKTRGKDLGGGPRPIGAVERIPPEPPPTVVTTPNRTATSYRWVPRSEGANSLAV